MTKEVREIVQPNIPKPDMKDPFSWASLARTHEKWLRAVGPQLGLDVSKMILGEVISSIVGDDANSFGFFFMPEHAANMKAHILERMDWEINVPETPEEIRVKLKEVFALISDLDFSKKENYSLAVTEWKKMRDFVKEETKKRPTWNGAELYAREANHVWSRHWRKFVGKGFFGEVE